MLLSIEELDNDNYHVLQLRKKRG